MRLKHVTSFALLAGIFALCIPVFAHHGSVAYDNTKLVELKQATVTKINWANPHILLLFDVKDDKGNVAHWVTEGGGPSAVSGSGWTRDAIQPGDTIDVFLYQVKNGNPAGRIGKVVLSSGKVLGSGDLAGDRPATCDQDFGNGGNESAACRPDGRKTNNKE